MISISSVQRSPFSAADRSQFRVEKTEHVRMPTKRAVQVNSCQAHPRQVVLAILHARADASSLGRADERQNAHRHVFMHAPVKFFCDLGAMIWIKKRNLRGTDGFLLCPRIKKNFASII
jgi:hypothetical protein